MKVSGVMFFSGAALALALFVPPMVRAQRPETLKVGAIDFFGVHGTDTAPLLAKLPIHTGQTVEGAKMHQLLDQIRSVGFAVTGMKVTDVNVVCCDTPNTWDFYIGLAGRSYRPLVVAAAPTGDVRLPANGLALYQGDMGLLLEAIQHGAAGENDLKGYALSKYAPMHKVELAMREYAVRNTERIEQVLKQSGDAQQRRAAATLLGYGERSAAQVAALSGAMDDADGEVRNNATRALEVLAAAGPLQGLNAEPLIAMLYSGSWTDRNKVSLLLERLTESHDAALLEALRKQAMGPLIDGARWHSWGHASPFLFVLGRIGNIDETRLAKMVIASKKDEIIAAAEKQ
ncbi:MAG: hypothetical protein WB439_12130 [Acidobacteriaceae bacterium]